MTNSSPSVPRRQNAALGMLFVAAFSAFMVGCGGGGSATPAPPPAVSPTPPAPPPASAASDVERPKSDLPVPTEQLKLAKFSGAGACTALETYIEDALIQQMQAGLAYQRDNPVGYRSGIPGITLASPVSGAPSNSPAPANYSVTNVRTEGVDEPDTVKNDGTRMFVISGSDVVHLRSWPASQLAEMARTSFSTSRPTGLLLQGNRLVVISAQYSPVTIQPAVLGTAGALPPPCIDCRYPDTGKTIISTYDVSETAKPTLQRQFEVQGSYITARLVGQSLRMVGSRQFQYPAGVQWYPSTPSAASATGPIQPWEPWASLAERTAAFNATIAKNEATIRAATLSALTPTGFTNAECSQVLAPNATSAFGWVSLSSLDLSLPNANQSVLNQYALTEAGLVYASATNLHLVTRHWYARTAAAQTDTSYVHRFGFNAGTGFELLASGTFEGSLKDDFSIDEAANGDLRLATQLLRYRANGATFTRELSSQMQVLRPSAGKLALVGKTAELAKGETIQSARIMGTRGFVVTFRAVDPLFTFDLSDGANPQVLGELKVPGFSSYLHPVDANTLVGIGTFLPEPDVNGRVDNSQRRVQLSLFDVSNLRTPKQSHNLLLGTLSATSAAQFDHKAFNYFAATKRLAIPFYQYGGVGSGFAPNVSTNSSLKVFDVSTQTGFAARGEISFNDILRSTGAGSASFRYAPFISRSVQADDYIYAIGDVAVRAANVADLSRPVATVITAK